MLSPRCVIDRKTAGVAQQMSRSKLWQVALAVVMVALAGAAETVDRSAGKLRSWKAAREHVKVQSLVSSWRGPSSDSPVMDPQTNPTRSLSQLNPAASEPAASSIEPSNSFVHETKQLTCKLEDAACMLGDGTALPHQPWQTEQLIMEVDETAARSDTEQQVSASEAAAQATPHAASQTTSFSTLSHLVCLVVGIWIGRCTQRVQRTPPIITQQPMKPPQTAAPSAAVSGLHPVSSTSTHKAATLRPHSSGTMAAIMQGAKHSGRDEAEPSVQQAQGARQQQGCEPVASQSIQDGLSSRCTDDACSHTFLVEHPEEDETQEPVACDVSAFVQTQGRQEPDVSSPRLLESSTEPSRCRSDAQAPADLNLNTPSLQVGNARANLDSGGPSTAVPAVPTQQTEQQGLLTVTFPGKPSQMSAQRLHQHTHIATASIGPHPPPAISLSISNEALDKCVAALAGLIRPATELAEGVTRGSVALQQLAGQMSTTTGLLATGCRQLGALLHVRQLEKQQALCARCMQFGLVVMSVSLLLQSASHGRLASMSGSCSHRLASQPHVSARLLSWLSLRHLAAAVNPVPALSLMACYCQQLGMFGMGLLSMYVGLPALYSLVGRQMASSWQVDIPLLLAGCGSAVGAMVVSWLGGYWTAWLLVWWLWCLAAWIMCSSEAGNKLVAAVQACTVFGLLPVLAAHLSFRQDMLPLHTTCSALLQPLLGSLSFV